MREEWRDVNGYEGLYKVSNLGRIKNSSEQLRKLSTQTNNYKSVILNKNGVKTRLQIHRLVAIAFIPNPENKPCVNHLNSKRDDNRSINLEWCTHSENQKHSIKVGTRSSLTRSNFTATDIRRIRKAVIGGTPIKVLAEKYNVKYNNIWEIATYKTFTDIK